MRKRFTSISLHDAALSAELIAISCCWRPDRLRHWFKKAAWVLKWRPNFCATQTATLLQIVLKLPRCCWVPQTTSQTDCSSVSCLRGSTILVPSTPQLHFHNTRWLTRGASAHCRECTEVNDWAHCAVCGSRIYYYYHRYMEDKLHQMFAIWMRLWKVLNHFLNLNPCKSLIECISFLVSYLYNILELCFHLLVS